MSHSAYLPIKKSYLLGLLGTFALLIIGIVFVDKTTSLKSTNGAQIAFAANTTTFYETFDGKPANPEPFTQIGQNTWDIQIHSRNNDTWDTLSAMDMHHSDMCGSPLTDTATAPFGTNELVTHHSYGAYEEAVFKCNDHVMTAINGIGKSINDSYALAVLTPNHMVDFTDQEATIRFNVTTYRTTQRDWIDIWITPWEDNLNLPFDTGTVDLQGLPMNTIQLVMFAPNDNSKSGFRPKILVNGQDTGEFQQFSGDYNWYTGYEDYLPGNAGSPKRRDTFEIKLSKTHISICMPQDSSDGAPSQTICWANKTIKPIPFTRGVVQFAHHSYTPNKDCNFYTPLTCGPDTWHWDDIYISPAVKFNMIKGDRRMVTGETTPVIFQAPAPAQSKLRFSAIGKVQLSFNNGSYISVSPQNSTQPTTGHVANYFVDVPQGTNNVRFKLSDQGSGVHAKDFAIWTQNSDGVPTTTPTNLPTSTSVPSVTPTIMITPTSLPSPTSTIIPTATATPTPTNVPTATISPTPVVKPTATPTNKPTSTPTPKPTVTSTPTVTPTPSGQIQGDINGDGKVNFTDMRIFWRYYGRKVSGGASQGDFNGDGVVNMTDFWILYSNYGR